VTPSLAKDNNTSRREEIGDQPRLHPKRVCDPSLVKDDRHTTREGNGDHHLPFQEEEEEDEDTTAW